MLYTPRAVTFNAAKNEAMELRQDNSQEWVVGGSSSRTSPAHLWLKHKRPRPLLEGVVQGLNRVSKQRYLREVHERISRECLLLSHIISAPGQNSNSRFTV